MGDVGSWQPGGSCPHMFPLEQGTGDGGLFTGINNWMAPGGFLSLRQPELGREGGGEKRAMAIFRRAGKIYLFYQKIASPGDTNTRWEQPRSAAGSGRGCGERWVRSHPALPSPPPSLWHPAHPWLGATALFPSFPRYWASLLGHPHTEGAVRAPLPGSVPSEAPGARCGAAPGAAAAGEGPTALPCNAALARRDPPGSAAPRPAWG